MPIRTVVKFVVFSLIIGLFQNLTAQTITSTKNGGNWGKEETWINKVIPTDKNNVIIDGPVILSTNILSCRTIIINPEGILQNGSSDATLHIYGTITNNGTILNDFGRSFSLECHGDIFNTGTWRPTTTYIAGSKTQRISRTPGTVFENSFQLSDATGTVSTTGRLVAVSPLTFSGEFDLHSRMLDMDSFSLALKGSGHVVGGTIQNVQDIHLLDNSYFSNTTIRSNVNLHDNVTIADKTVFEGDVVNYGRMQFTGLRKASVAGNFVNRGVVYSSTRHQFYSGEFTTNVTDSFIVESAGFQPPQHLNNPVADWWRVASDNEEECNSLRFYYSDDALNDNAEHSLWLYQSTDGGDHWSPLKKDNFSQLNAADNFIEFKNVLLSKDNYFALAKDTSRVVTMNIAEAQGSVQLRGAFPNPVNKNINLAYSLSRSGAVKLSITDESGKTVIPALDEYQNEGSHHYNVDCSKLPSGTYYASLQQDDVMQVTKFSVKR